MIELETFDELSELTELETLDDTLFPAQTDAHNPKAAKPTRYLLMSAAPIQGFFRPPRIDRNGHAGVPAETGPIKVDAREGELRDPEDVET
jgi:hypothetical protein